MVELDVRPFIMLFVVLDPIGVAPYIQSALTRVSPEKRGHVVRLAVASALVILIAFTIIGDILFSMLNVSISDFQIAAGLVLLIYAVASLFEFPIGYSESSDEGIAIFPLATPLLAGPGAVSTVIYIKYTYGTSIALLSTVVNMVLALPILMASRLIVRLLGRHGSLLIDKFMSLIMAGFAVSIIRQGLEALPLL